MNCIISGRKSQANKIFPQAYGFPVDCTAIMQNSALAHLDVHYKCLGSGSAEKLLRLTVHQDYLAVWQTTTANLVDCFQFDFSVKFSIKFQNLQDAEDHNNKLGEAVSILFTVNQQPSTLVEFRFLPANSIQVLRFRRELETKYVAQINFHTMFKAVKKLGKGLTASVYEALRLEDGKLFAIKSFKKSHYFAQDNGKGKKAFLKELFLLVHIKHSSICPFFGVYESENSVYMVFQRLSMSLFTYLTKNLLLSFSTIKEILRDLLKAIWNLHQQGIMHRDIKLENIMMRQLSKTTYEPVIIDFGLAQYVQNPHFLYTKCGTPGYTAPELFRDVQTVQKHSEEETTKVQKWATEKCDIFSLGVVLYIMIFRKPLFEGKTPKEILQSNITGNFKLPIQQLSGIGNGLGELLLRMVECDPVARISALEAVKQLEMDDLYLTVKSPTATQITDSILP